MEELGRGTIGGGLGLDGLPAAEVVEVWRLDILSAGGGEVVSRVSCTRLSAGLAGERGLWDDVENSCDMLGFVARPDTTTLTPLCSCPRAKTEGLIGRATRVVLEVEYRPSSLNQFMAM